MSNLYVLRDYVKKYKEMYNLVDFIETGCYLGDGILRCVEQGFDSSNCYTCDIGQDFVNQVRNRFPQSTVLCTDSISFLEEILPHRENKTLFWLDAHFPEFFKLEVKEEKHRMPLIDEIKTIKKLKKNYEQDVFLIDDTQCFKSKNNPMFREGKLSDNLIVNGWEVLYTILSDTHIVEHLTEFSGEPNFEGVLICIPK